MRPVEFTRHVVIDRVKTRNEKTKNSGLIESNEIFKQTC